MLTATDSAMSVRLAEFTAEFNVNQEWTFRRHIAFRHSSIHTGQQVRRQATSLIHLHTVDISIRPVKTCSNLFSKLLSHNYDKTKRKLD